MGQHGLDVDISQSMMISIYCEWLSQQKMAPFLEGCDYGKEFLLVGSVAGFCWLELL